MITLPGLIDPHVHLRTPGQEFKEDFYTGTSAALAGGYATILDMPNNKVPITTLARLEEKIAIAKKQIVCDVGFYFGSLGDNLDEFDRVKNKVTGLKLYLNETTGNFLIDTKGLAKIFDAWNGGPILLHAEDDAVEEVIKIARKIRIPVHFCHISTASDLRQIIKAKNAGLPITCGVTPHHLFLTEHDAKVLGPYGKMKPPLKNKKDVDFLWKNLAVIDIVESDHAPHTIEEKEGRIVQQRGGTTGKAPDNAQFVRGVSKTSRAPWEKRAAGLPAEASAEAGPVPKTPYGVPGLETTLPLLLTAVSERRLTIDDIIRLCHTNPSAIFNIKQDSQTKIDVDTHKSYIFDNQSLFTKSGWSPFAGWKMKGKVVKVVIRSKTVFKDGTVVSSPGSGNIVVPI